MKQYKGIVFDLDGTLLNTIQDLADSVNYVLAYYGYSEHGYEDYKLKIGKGFQHLLEMSLPKDRQSDAMMEKALDMFVKAYAKRYLNKTAPYKGIEAMLEKLQEKGIKMGVNSNKRNDYSSALIKKNFPQISFVGIFGEREDVPRKPNPQAALELVGLMNLKPEEVLYMGDSQIDMETGKNAGMDTIGVLWGFRKEDELIEGGAAYIVKAPEEVTALF